MPETTQPAAAPAPLPDLTGRTLGDYQVLRRLGAGGMGQVYLARQTLAQARGRRSSSFATDLAADSTALLRFEAEAARRRQAQPPEHRPHPPARRVRRPALHGAGVRRGRNLRDHLAASGPPDLPVTLSIIKQVVLALQKAHEQGIVHRDIKPENILVTSKVEVKVTDFGLSRFFTGATPALNLTQSGVTLGTPLYMSPEQVQGKRGRSPQRHLLARRDLLPPARRRAALPRRDGL